MEWLLIVYLGMVEIPNPPPRTFESRAACVEVARVLASRHDWLTYYEADASVLKTDPTVLRPLVHCEPKEWRKPPDSK